ncbi:MAG: SDR family NAD(P)-dependent oxidoreductase [Synechococcales cyanobacterium T60_A2020_003]|nr:SDR family NAD(P)-dependent oxidoreductase [Synechococcales cyanobacterium T60_A2020_003]
MTPSNASQSTHALIVGANGGIGLGFVQALLAQSSVQVYATYRDPNRAQALLTLAQSQSDRLKVYPLDLTDEDQVSQLVTLIQAETPVLHQVINCVGVLHEGTYQPEKSLRQINSDQLMHYFQVNSIGAVLLAKHLLPLFRHGDRSLFASISAKVGSIEDNRLGGWYGYRASKAALNMFMKTIAIEYTRKCPNTIVVALHPGTTDTSLSKPFQANVPPEKLFSVERTVGQLLTVLDSLTPADTGNFYSWDGSRLPW